MFIYPNMSKSQTLLFFFINIVGNLVNLFVYQDVIWKVSCWKYLYCVTVKCLLCAVFVATVAKHFLLIQSNPGTRLSHDRCPSFQN